ncbi:MAG: S-methyl-5-thioribose-1-phosphate isomerase [Bacteroidales bacterium]|nr:S-methyl-5-thioribose-1-phosphate isomerase [Bacteroidales bacterium]
MQVGSKYYESLWFDENDPGEVKVIDQQRLPWEFQIVVLENVEEVYLAIREMTVRGAPVIGVLAAFGMYLNAYNHADDPQLQERLDHAAEYLISSRPTAVNLAHAVREQQKVYYALSDLAAIPAALLKRALEMLEAEKVACRRIGEYGYALIRELSENKKGKPVNILTHCNAGWLATIDYGTALAPVYEAHIQGIPVHVWVDETRPRNQGARLTMWELEQAGVPCTLVADNVGGHLMQHGMVDIVLVGSDHTTQMGDTANKIGTYLKALAAQDNHIPFFVALPFSTIDMALQDGITDIEIEQRAARELIEMEGMMGSQLKKVNIVPPETPVVNYVFDVTPARLITGLITEKGICEASEKGIDSLLEQ